MNTPFPRPFTQAELGLVSQQTGLKFRDQADVSQEELAKIWLELVAPNKIGKHVGLITKDRLKDQTARVSLYAYVAYLTLLIRLAKSYLAGQVSGSVFTTIMFDWTRYLGRHASQAGYRLTVEYDHLIDQIDKYAQLEQEKGTYGMLDDQRLRSLAEQILTSLEQFWRQTKSSLLSDKQITK